SRAAKLASPEFQLLWALAAFLVLGGVSIFLSLSRGGVISMIVAASITVPLIAIKAHVKGGGWMGMLIVLLVLLLMFYLWSDALYRRFASVTQADSTESRIQMLKDLTKAWKQFPLLGAGLGTYRQVFPMFDESKISAVATHAENEYAQIMTETGAIGLAM